MNLARHFHALHTHNFICQITAKIKQVKTKKTYKTLTTFTKLSKVTAIISY